MDHNNFESEGEVVPVQEGHHGHEHDDKVDKLWEQSSQNEVVVGLKDKSLDRIEIEDFDRAFSEKPKCLRCSDGRIHEIGLGRAGMGIVAGLETGIAAIEEEIKAGRLKGEPSDLEFLKQVCDAIIEPAAEEAADRLIKDGCIDKDEGFEITSHTGCGAMGIVCKELKRRGWMPESFDADEFGKIYGRRVVQKLWDKGCKAGYRHIEAGEMDEVHDERVVYFDGTRTFNNETLVKKDYSGKEAKVLPRGFILSGLDYDEKVTEVELDALCGIAMGDHGFGKRIDSENPLYIVILAANEKQRLEFEKIAEKVAKKRGSIEIRSSIPSGLSIDK